MEVGAVEKQSSPARVSSFACTQPVFPAISCVGGGGGGGGGASEYAKGEQM